MAQEQRASTSQNALKSLSRRQYQPQRQLHQTDEYDDEVSEEIVSLPYRKAYEMAAKFAATNIGQFIIKRGERILDTIETTAKWSLPKAQFDGKLQRPLPWIPFLMLIITLRLARVWLSIAALMIGNSPVKANDVVYFIQTRRRKLRSLRSNGAKEMKENTKKSGYQKSALKSQLKQIFSKAICRPGGQRNHQNDESNIVIFTRSTNNEDEDHQASKRFRCDDESDPDITLEQKLEKYSMQNSDDDPDYVPDQTTLSATETSANSTATAESVDEGEAVLNEQPSNTINSHQEENSQQNESVEMIDNEQNSETLPKPMIEIKKETQSDAENNEIKGTASEDHEQNHGAENRAAEVALKTVSQTQAHGVYADKQNMNIHTIETGAEHKRKSTAGHPNADEVKLQKKSALNVTAAAGSPPDFNACVQQQNEQQFQIQQKKYVATNENTDEWHAKKVVVKEPAHYPLKLTAPHKRHQQHRGNRHAKGQGQHYGHDHSQDHHGNSKNVHQQPHSTRRQHSAQQN